MFSIRMNLGGVSKILAVWLFFNAVLVTTTPFSIAGEKEDLATASRLITMIESGDAGQVGRAQELFDSIPEGSKSKPIAGYTFALIQMREGKYSEAWKVLVAPSNVLVLVPDSIKIGKEKLKLWLLLEAGAADKAEPQFKRLVTLSLGLDSADSDQIASCGLVGGVVGMLKTDVNVACIPLPILEKAKELLLTKLESKNAIAKLEEQLADARNWGEELSALVSKFESMGNEKADEQNKSIQAEFERIKQEQLKLRGDLKSAGGGRKELEDKRKQWIKARSVTLQEMKQETKNKPIYPVAPGPTPRPPVKPQGSNQIDPQTKAAKFVPPTRDELKRYEVALQFYNNLATAASNYESLLRQYPAKLELWKKQDAERRDALQAQKQEADDEIASAEKLMKDMQEDIKEGIGKDYKQSGEKFEQLERFAAISSIAFKHVTSNDPEAKNLLRPSNFQLLDYDSECTQLRKSLR